MIGNIRPYLALLALKDLIQTMLCKDFNIILH